jgi:hypothetical protein
VKNESSHVRFEVLTAVSTKMAVFWVVAPCSLVEVYQHFRGPCCLHHQGSMDLWNIGKILPHYMALQPRRQPSLKVVMLIVVFWVVTLCSVVRGYQRFRGMYHLHLQGSPSSHHTTSQPRRPRSTSLLSESQISESSHGLFQSTITVFAWRDQEKNIWRGQPASQPRLKSEISRIWWKSTKY